MRVLGIPVVLDPNCPDVAVATGFWPFYRIRVGVRWYGLTGEERAAVLMHEVGHCRRHHAFRRLVHVPLVILWALGYWAKERACAITKAHELEADRFAADHGYARELAHALGRFTAAESPFYPDHDTRRAILLQHACKEKTPC